VLKGDFCPLSTNVLHQQPLYYYLDAEQKSNFKATNSESAHRCAHSHASRQSSDAGARIALPHEPRSVDGGELYVCVHIYIYIYIYIWGNTGNYMCVYIYIYIDIYIYIYILYMVHQR